MVASLVGRPVGQEEPLMEAGLDSLGKLCTGNQKLTLELRGH